MTKDHTPDVFCGKSVRELMNEIDRDLLKMLIKAGKTMDEAPVPTEGRMIYDPETGEFIKTPEKKYSATRPESGL